MERRWTDGRISLFVTWSDGGARTNEERQRRDLRQNRQAQAEEEEIDPIIIRQESRYVCKCNHYWQPADIGEGWMESERGGVQFLPMMSEGEETFIWPEGRGEEEKSEG